MMTEKYDDEARAMMQHAVEDLQYWIASAGADTTEASVLAWQQGYISGANRAMGIKNAETE
jgi:hypothetical protein